MLCLLLANTIYQNMIWNRSQKVDGYKNFNSLLSKWTTEYDKNDTVR